MVRLYCLTKIIKIVPPPRHYCKEKVLPYKDGAEENLHIGHKENITAYYLRKDFSDFYEFTEICIGYDYVEENNRKVYVMHFYRDDTKLCVIRMIRGAVKFRRATPNALDLTISTSALFSSDIKFDLFMRIRWIKNTPTGTKIIDKEEEILYREFAKMRKRDEKNIKNKGDKEKQFEKIELKLPNSSKPNVLRTKISRFLTLIKCLCDSSTGSFKNVPSDYEYNQQVKCYLSERTNQWDSKKPRKYELDKQIQNFRDCITLRWTNLNMKNQNLENFEANNVRLVNFEYVQIFDSEQNLYPSFKKMFCGKSNFVLLKQLSLENCNIQKLSDEFFDILPVKLQTLHCQANNITKISKNIYKFTNLKELKLDRNKNLEDRGIPWEFLPPSLIYLKLVETNISTIPKEIGRLVNLRTLEVSSKNLKHIEWSEIHNLIVNLIIEGGVKLNEINLIGKSNLNRFHILSTGIEQIDCSKLPPNLQDFKMSKNKVEIFDARKNLEEVDTIWLANNELEAIVWENLPYRLRTITIEDNNLTIIDDGISHLVGLKIILANDNKINKISDEFWRLQQLTTLDLVNNEISSLPKRFEMLENLKTLNLSYNKFNHQKTNLNETLWKRLPKSLRVLLLDGNNLHSLPCWLNGYTFTDLKVDDCKLAYICPTIYVHDKSLNLSIKKNYGIKFLPFIPSKIYYPKDQNDEILEDSSNFTIFIDKEMLIGKSSSNWEPLYQFKKSNDLKLECSCCATCGNETDEAVVEQLMIMDFNLKVSKEPKIRDYPAIESERNFLLPTLPSSPIAFSDICTSYTPGKWQTAVRTRLCPDCLKIIKSKIVESQKENSTKKCRTINNGNDEICIPFSSYLLFKNSNENDSILIAVINLLDAMKPSRNIIGNSENEFQIELTKILRRKVSTLGNLKQIVSSYTTCRNSVTLTLENIIKLLDEECKELFQFSCEKRQICMCWVDMNKSFSQHFILSFSVGQVLTSAESFESLLNRWYKYDSKFCFHCFMNTVEDKSVIISDKQKYLILEINSRIKMAKNESEQCPISSESFNVNSQEIFGKKWKLIAAAYSNLRGKYSTWRRYENHWIVINEEEFRIVENLFSDFKDYKYFLFEKIEEGAKNESILSELDQTMITVHKNVTFHTSSALLQPQIPEMTFPPPQQDQMEVDVNYPITSSEQDHYFNPNFVAASNQYIAPPQNYYNEFSYPQEDTSYANYPNPNYSSYYNQSNLPPQHEFHQTYQDPCETTDWDNQNGAQTNYQNYSIPRNYEYFLPGNNGEYGIYGLQQPTNVSDAQEQPMDISFYPTEEDSWFFNP